MEVKKALPKTIIINTNDTGVSYFFTLKQRACKVKRAKKLIILELNIELTTQLRNSLKDEKSVFEIEDITAEIAKKKKYGTMKHLIKLTDTSLINKLITDIVTTYKK